MNDVFEYIDQESTRYNNIIKMYCQDSIFVCNRAAGNMTFIQRYKNLYAQILTKIFIFSQFINSKISLSEKGYVKDVPDKETQQILHDSIENMREYFAQSFIPHIDPDSGIDYIPDIQTLPAYVANAYGSIKELSYTVFEEVKKMAIFNKYRKDTFKNFSEDFSNDLLEKATIYGEPLNSVDIEKAIHNSCPDYPNIDLAGMIFLTGTNYLMLRNELLTLIMEPLRSSLFKHYEDITKLESKIFEEIENENKDAILFNDKSTWPSMQKKMQLVLNKNILSQLWKSSGNYLWNEKLLLRSCIFINNESFLKKITIEVDQENAYIGILQVRIKINLRGDEYLNIVKGRIKKCTSLLTWIEKNGYEMKSFLKKINFFVDFDIKTAFSMAIVKKFKDVVIKDYFFKDPSLHENGKELFSEIDTYVKKFDQEDVEQKIITVFNKLHTLYLKSMYKHIFEKAVHLNVMSEKEINTLIKNKPNKNFFLANLFAYLKNKLISLYKLLPLDEHELNKYIANVENILINQENIEDTINTVLLGAEYERYMKLKKNLNVQPNIHINMENKHIITWARESNLLPVGFQFYSTDHLKEIIKNELRILFEKANFQDLSHKLDKVETLQGLTGLYNEYLILNNQMKQNQNAKKIEQAQAPMQQPPSAYSFSGIWNRMTSWYSRLRFKKSPQ